MTWTSRSDALFWWFARADEVDVGEAMIDHSQAMTDGHGHGVATLVAQLQRDLPVLGREIAVDDPAVAERFAA